MILDRALVETRVPHPSRFCLGGDFWSIPAPRVITAGHPDPRAFTSGARACPERPRVQPGGVERGSRAHLPQSSPKRVPHPNGAPFATLGWGSLMQARAPWLVRMPSIGNPAPDGRHSLAQHRDPDTPGFGVTGWSTSVLGTRRTPIRLPHSLP